MIEIIIDDEIIEIKSIHRQKKSNRKGLAFLETIVP